MFATFVLYPFVRVLMMSVQGSDLFGRPTGWIGLHNYARIFGDPQTLTVLGRTAAFVLGVVAGRLVFGLAVAIPLARKGIGRALFRRLLVSPMAVSVAGAATAFSVIFSPIGLINSILADLGRSPVGWLTDPSVALFSVIVVTIWTDIGFTILLLVAALDAIDPDVMEAADIDGASAPRRLFAITMPLISPTLFFIVVTGTIGAVRAFGQIRILTNGGPANATTTLVYELYLQAFGAGSQDFGLASALGVVLFVIVCALAIIQFGGIERRVHYR